jgi:hypothetical protein
VGENYFSSLAIDPATGQPAFLIGDYDRKNTRYATRSTDGTWTEEIVDSTTGRIDDRNVYLTFSPDSGNAAGFITRFGKGKSKNLIFVERLGPGNWIDSLTLPNYRNYSFSYDMNGFRFIALNQDQSVQLLHLDQPGSSPEVISSQNGHSPWLRFSQTTGLPAAVFETSDGTYEYANFAEFDGSNWNSTVYKISPPDRGVDSPAFDFDPNGEPMAVSAESHGFWVARRNAQGVWEETSAPVPTINGIGGIQGMQFRGDGTVFVLFQNGTALTVGRFCESGRGFTCVTKAVWPEVDTWVWETVTVELSGLSTGGFMDLDSSGLPAVGWGNDMKTLYAHCRPGISKVCEPLPSP